MSAKRSRIRGLAAVCGWALAVGLAGAACADTPRVHLPAGAVSGVEADRIAVFKGLPYAAPPVGPLRWRAPQPAPAWKGELKADAFGPGCPQPKRPGGVAPGGVPRFAPPATSEDCLTLNVWTPGKRGDKLPVMVWIHGGAFQVGGSALPYFDGHAFAKQGVVLVSFNYRLGKLGFFAHPLIAAGAGDEPVGNYGLMDQIAALKWVRANIASFGGDPHNVTAFGESAGGASLLFLLTSPAAKGLFDKAIVESGGGWQPAPPLAVQERQDETALAQQFGHGFTDAAQLRALPVDDLLSLPRSGLRGPFVDGRVVTRSPRAAIAAGAAADIPMIIGTNTDEARPLMLRLGSDPQVVLGQLDAAGEAVYADEGATPAVKARRVYTDAAFTAPARWVAARTAGGAPTWLYSFSYVPQALRRPDEGASHGAEIPFVFDSWDRIGGGAAFLTPQDKAYAQTMNRCWASFAKTGTPQCAGQDWPRYTPQDDALMQFDDRPHVVTGFRRPMLDWQETRTAKVARARSR